MPTPTHSLHDPDFKPKPSWPTISVSRLIAINCNHYYHVTIFRSMTENTIYYLFIHLSFLKLEKKKKVTKIYPYAASEAYGGGLTIKQSLSLSFSGWRSRDTYDTFSQPIYILIAISQTKFSTNLDYLREFLLNLFLLLLLLLLWKKLKWQVKAQPIA